MAVRDGKINLSHISGCFEPNPLVKPGQFSLRHVDVLTCVDASKQKIRHKKGAVLNKQSVPKERIDALPTQARGASRSFALCRCEEIPELNSTDVRHGARHPITR